MDAMFAMSRRDAEEDWRSTVTVSRDGEPSVWDGTQYVPTVETVYAGGGRVRTQGTAATVVQAGGRPVTMRTYDVQIPPDVDVRIDDRIVVDSSTDPVAEGLHLRVIDAPKTEWLSVRNVVAVEES